MMYQACQLVPTNPKTHKTGWEMADLKSTCLFKGRWRPFQASTTSTTFSWSPRRPCNGISNRGTSRKSRPRQLRWRTTVRTSYARRATNISRWHVTHCTDTTGVATIQRDLQRLRRSTASNLAMNEGTTAGTISHGASVRTREMIGCAPIAHL